MDAEVELLKHQLFSSRLDATSEEKAKKTPNHWSRDLAARTHTHTVVLQWVKKNNFLLETGKHGRRVFTCQEGDDGLLFLSH